MLGKKKLNMSNKNCLKVVLFGPESTGKTTLANHLAQHYKTNYVPEYARDYLQSKWDKYKDICSLEDLPIIVKGQKLLENNILKESNKIGIELEFAQSNIEGELVNLIQDARKKYDGIIINAAGFTHTSVAIRDALDLFKKPIIELHISNIYKREEFRHKSLISDIVTGGIFGLGVEGYILAIISLQKILKNENK